MVANWTSLRKHIVWCGTVSWWVGIGIWPNPPPNLSFLFMPSCRLVKYLNKWSLPTMFLEFCLITVFSSRRNTMDSNAVRSGSKFCYVNVFLPSIFPRTFRNSKPKPARHYIKHVVLFQRENHLSAYSICRLSASTYCTSHRFELYPGYGEDWANWL